MTCYSGGTLEIFIEPQHPRPRLLIVGGLPVAQALAHLGAAMNYQVVAVDPTGEATGMESADHVLSDLDEIAAFIGPFTYVVVATHGTHDEAALERILKSRPSYVGLVASPRRAAAVRQYLATRGLSDEEMLSLKSPAGVDIQAQRGDEIALSIMAEIVQRRRNAEMLNLALFQNDEEDAAKTPSVAADTVDVAASSAATDAPDHAIDPVCRMEVEIAGAAYTAQFDGETYYFCCAGCQRSFEEASQSYLESEAAAH
jgi:xanthine dehydrogenase accessory factor